jgi:predicted N-acyltransferase
VQWVQLESMQHISPSEWNRLAWPDGLYSSHEWLTAVEDEVQGHCTYLLGRDEDELLAAIPLYFVTGTALSMYDPSSHFSLMHSPGEKYCLAGSLSGYRNAPLIASGLSCHRRDKVLAELLEVVRRTALDETCGSIAMLFLTPEGTARMLAGGRPFVQATLTYVADAHIVAPGDSFQDYKNSLSRNRRGTVQNEINRFQRSGLTMSVEDPRNYFDLIVRLTDQVNQKYSRVVSREWLESSLSAQLNAFGDRSLLFVCRDGRAVIGLALAYEWGGWLYERLAGFDYDRLPGAFEYFNLLMYEPLEYCYAHGLNGVHLGVGLPEAKAGRGAQLDPLVSMLLAGHPGSPQDPAPVCQFWERHISDFPRSFESVTWERAMDLAKGGQLIRSGQ